MGRDDSHVAGAVLVAFVLGAVSGAAMALFWAQSSDPDTRKFLQSKARETKGRASDTARQGREFLNKQRETITTAIDRGREAYQQARERDKA